MRTIKQTSHGLHGTPVYRLWGDVVKRCESKNSHNFKYYGGRGIKICDEWRNSPKSFCEWALNNGYEKGKEIDRIDVNGDYTPANCQFITHKENCAINKRRLRITSKSGHRNIVKTKANTFETYGHKNKKQHFLGTHKTIEEAIIVRDNFENNIDDNPELLKQKDDEFTI